ncbi:hypothetical protein LSAT2_032227 [Lamellibrachia satsuma]|nr:hypothetical protein LSAT2_032227 [Lamellibrachia satsuma]
MGTLLAVFALLFTTVRVADVTSEIDKDYSMYDYCMMICNYWLNDCIIRHCRGRSWPRPVPKECMDKRYKCAEDCQLYKSYDYTHK